MSEHYPFVNTPLPYPYNALEPYIDEKTMHLHHDKHLQTYIDNLNTVLREQCALQKMSLHQLICVSSSLPAKVGIPLARNAGGVFNHRFYFDGLHADGAQEASKALSLALQTSFGSFHAFQKEFTEAALSVFGSGYAWLVCGKQRGLSIITTANQETPLTMGLFPLLSIDVWEHAYYLKHFNKRVDYINDWWNVVNWTVASELFANCQNLRCGHC